jgi:hypothetical protein
VTFTLVRRPRLLRGSIRGQIAADLALVTLLPGTRFEAGRYWALPPGGGHGLRLRQEDRFGAVLELVATNPKLAHGPYRRAGFEIVPGQEEHRRPTMRRIPRPLAGPPAATGDEAHAGRRWPKDAP